MTREEQHKWLNEQMMRDPYFAQSEFDIRRQAVEVYRMVCDNNTPNDAYFSVLIRRPGMSSAPRGWAGVGYQELKLRKGDFLMIGGLEATLLIEEIIRRAMHSES